MYQLYLCDRNASLQATGKPLPFDNYDLTYHAPKKELSSIEKTLKIMNDIKNLKWSN